MSETYDELTDGTNSIQVKGTLAIISCAMLEDEVVHCIVSDKSIKKIFALNDWYTEAFVNKLEKYSIPVTLVDTWEDYSQYRNLDEFHILVGIMNYEYHTDPKLLRENVENIIQSTNNFVDTVGVFYGLCGNYGWDVSQWAKDNKLKPVITLRDKEGNICDDCISTAVGGQIHFLSLIIPVTHS